MDKVTTTITNTENGWVATFKVGDTTFQQITWDFWQACQWLNRVRKDLRVQKDILPLP